MLLPLSLLLLPPSAYTEGGASHVQSVHVRFLEKMDIIGKDGLFEIGEAWPTW